MMPVKVFNLVLNSLPTIFGALLTILAIILTHYVCKKLLLFYKFKDYPHLKGGFFLGDLATLRHIKTGDHKAFMAYYLENYEKFKDKKIRLFWKFWTPMINVYDIDGITQIFSNRNIIDKGEEVDSLVPWLGRGLLTSSGSRWHNRRKLITPAFHFRMLDHFVATMANTTLAELDRLAEKAPLTTDIRELTGRFALAVLFETTMGLSPQDFDDKTLDEYISSVHRVLELICQKWKNPLNNFNWYYHLTQPGKEFQVVIDKLYMFTRKAIEKRIPLIQSALSENSDNTENIYLDLKLEKKILMDILLRAYLVEKNLTLDDLVEEVNTFMFAGHHTTATSIMWAIFILGNNQDIQEKLYQELKQSFDSNSKELDYQEIASHKYLDACVKECMRLIAPVPYIVKVHNQDLNISGYHVPKDTPIMINFFLLHRNEKLHPNPLKFDPDRFMGDRVGQQFWFMPFSAGPRNCIGQKFALLEIKIFLIYLILKFKFRSLKPVEQADIMFEIVTTAKSPIDIEFISREDAK